MKTNSFRTWTVEEKRGRRLDHVPAQFVPGIALSKNVFRQALRAITAVSFLHGFKHQFSHMPPSYGNDKGALARRPPNPVPTDLQSLFPAPSIIYKNLLPFPPTTHATFQTRTTPLASQRQIDANRRNAQKCRGPKSATGRAISSQNALKHGLHAKSQILPCELPADLAALAIEYQTRFAPSTPEECSLVDTLISSEWLGRRDMRVEATIREEQIALMASPTLDLAFTRSSAALRRIGGRQNAVQRDFIRALKQLTRLRTIPKRPLNPQLDSFRTPHLSALLPPAEPANRRRWRPLRQRATPYLRPGSRPQFHRLHAAKHPARNAAIRWHSVSASVFRAPVLLAAALALAGCVRYQPHPLDPPRSEQQFRARSLSDPGLIAFLKRTDWPPAKLQLRDLYAVALYYNPDLDVARARLRTAQAAIITANTRPNPSLSIGGGFTTAPESPLVFYFTPNIILETGGKRALRTLEADKLAEAARVDVDATAWNVMSRVRTAWTSYAMALGSVDVLNNEISARNETIAILEKRLSVGEGARPEVDTARALLIGVQAEARAASTAVSEAAANLAAAIGLPSLPPVDTTRLPETLADLTLGDIQKTGLLHRADIRRSLLEYAADEAALHLEIAKQWPDIQLNPGYEFNEGAHQISFGPGFPIPVFNRNKGPIAEAEARRAEAEVRFNALQAQAIGEMETALATYKGARTELNDADRTLTAIGTTRTAAMERAVAAGEEDRLALSGVHIETAVSARARLDAERRLQGALGALDDAVQQPLEPGPRLPDPETKP